MQTKTINLTALGKLVLGIIITILLTVALLFGSLNIATDVVPRELWHKEIQKLLAESDASDLMSYADLLTVDDKSLSEGQKEAIAVYEERYDPEKTNLRYTVTLGGKELASTYKDEEVLAQRTRFNNLFVGSEEDLQKIADYEAYHYHGYYDTTTIYYEDEADNTDEITHVVPTPPPYATEEGYDTTYPTPTPEVQGKPDIISSEEYHQLQDKCYEPLIVDVYILADMTADDHYAALYEYTETVFDYAGANKVYDILCLCLGVLLTLILIVSAGRRNAEGEYIAAGTGLLPWDVWFVLWCCVVAALGVCAVGAVVIPLQVLFEGISYYDGAMVQSIYHGDVLELIVKLVVGAAIVCIAALVGSVYSVAARVKVRGWWRNCLTWKIMAWCWKWCLKVLRWCWNLCRVFWNAIAGTVKAVPMIWKAALVLCGLWLAETLYCCAFVWSSWALVGVLWAILKLVVCIWLVLMLKRLHDGAKIIADGDLNHRIELKNMYGDLKTHGEYLNRIGEGLSRSVENQLRSERMKTELITNVSHDLKTPLTSIVNYVDLLKKEDLTGTAGEYVDVLDRQSARLKKLTEDLVEASKASSGALTVTPRRISLNELMEQVQAEYGSRLEEAMLTPVIRVPEGKTEVWADGKYVWRILDNLLGNVCKYAMPGTRVYLELTTREDMAVFSVKNMSRESLNISADELVERFVRGDSSRNTEGSGLGLSIAQSLAKLMGGEVKITIDGDLFKADVILPAVK